MYRKVTSFKSLSEKNSMSFKEQARIKRAHTIKRNKASRLKRRLDQGVSPCQYQDSPGVSQ